ncbi:MAG: N-acetylmuramoyl-L-alanine amidase [Planctomycetes bacterium]|nr:N-acetylmuramoyl-L-alanine amidase [Planctomycetota bacterium]
MIASFFGPRALTRWCTLSRLEKLLLACGFLCTLLIALPFAIDRGLSIPFTDFDEYIRESFQRVSWIPSAHTPVQYAGIRDYYYTNVSYVIPSGEYRVARKGKEGGPVIQKYATVRIEPGSTFLMEPGANLLVFGTLEARGTPDQRISFRAAVPGQRWGNITLWERESGRSRLAYCSISGGSGRKCKGSEGAFVREEGGYAVGGGLLLYDSAATVEQTSVSDCEAVYGGGIYLRSDSQTTSIPSTQDTTRTGPPVAGGRTAGPTLWRVAVKGCVAKAPEDKTRAGGGGGVFVSGTYPELSACEISDNRTEGKLACGGGLYVATGARVRLVECTVANNVAQAEGGGMYAYKIRDDGDENTSGIVVQGGTISRNLATGAGGGISGFNARVRLTKVTVEDNRVTMGGPTEAIRSSGGGVLLKFETAYAARTSVFLEDCDISRNTAEVPRQPQGLRAADFAGGGLVLDAPGKIPLVLRNVRCAQNDAMVGRHFAMWPRSHYAGWDGSWSQVRCREPENEEGSQAIYDLSGANSVRPIVLPLPDDCSSLRPPSAQVDTVVLHYTSARNVLPDQPYDRESILAIFRAEVPGTREKTSAHYLIERDGAVIELVNEALKAWHAGRACLPTGESDVNERSIGIEMVRKAEDIPTDEQYRSLALLLCDIKRRHPKVIRERIVGHDLIRTLWNQAHPPQERAEEKTDPGPLFHWSRLMAELDRNGFDAAK